MSRSLGGGHAGGGVVCTCVPDSTFKLEIDALIVLGTAIVGKLVDLTWVTNYEVTSPADGGPANGIILECIPTLVSGAKSYNLTCRLWSYDDQNGTLHAATCIDNVPYVATFNLQDTILVNSTTYVGVKDGGTGGFGACIAKDVPASGYADIIF